MRILIVEDDQALGEGIQMGLRQGGWQADWVQDGEAAGHALASEPFAALVLDLGLPKVSGLEVLRQLRARGDAMPVLILTARDAPDDVVAGLDAGADDYMIKPFNLQELGARLRALTRRRGGRAVPEIVHGNLRLDPAGRRVTLAGQAVELSAREFDLLHELLAQAGRVLTKAQIESHLYAWGSELESNAIEVHIHHLRRKLGADLIRTVRGVGYLIPEAGRSPAP
ncbi:MULTISPECIES: response regulator transcription factor [Azospira]|jgi:DNA-binding response OmpR family regulator|uniref:Response regulator with CheY-like receiver domain and winged-helix DNA-binding domain n=2 Tax=Azospira oryzae TaxID=146939 RepID=G8QKC8_AZOOP|nr:MULTISPECIES: response regulator transcription factor [Azospira]AEV26611.1 response regulator with CheY-like receiver domain and winged-helix DNA-binding domain [Azospira oryzae PS]MDK9690337.1 response regulator transcription factor [Azospira sp.]RZT89650.1 winged helix family two component transcriptional regulator [Azospira oryzae]TLS16943.1 MAG: response regulator transcription factor [Betaproteobacteria bacterium]